MTKAKPGVVVKQTEPPIETAILAESIVAISKAVDVALSAGLHRRTICILVKANTGIPIETVSKVLDTLQQLRQLYTTR